jgi:hypothetical protein
MCRYEVFVKRLELSEEPAAKEFLRATNAQMLNGGVGWRMLRGCFEVLLHSMLRAGRTALNVTFARLSSSK